jgi:insulysin
LELLEKLVNDKFSAIENFDVELPDNREPAPFGAGQFGKVIKYIPVKDNDQLRMYWILPYCEDKQKSKPLTYLSHLFGHEGENSLLSYLKSEGLALELGAGDDHSMNAISAFMIDIYLTKKGLAQYERVIEAVFQYAQRLRDAGP